ncbi:FKBP-type peptidyl-prolyl cis-trans isomerase SlyD [Oxalobacteraceae bacterium GrIS 2.11]
MKIAQNTAVSLNYSMFDKANQLIDKNVEPIVYLHGGYDNILPPVEAALEGHSAGETVVISMTAEEAFGEIEDSLIREEDVGLFPPDIEVGMMFETHDPETGEPHHFRITSIDAGKVTVDGNHPLAGMPLRFEASIIDVREASDEEIAHGHIHGEHGHEH